jgi:tetratricopeptide (TPR) repeat protein
MHPRWQRFDSRCRIAQGAIEQYEKSAKLGTMPVSNSALLPLPALLREHRVTIEWLRCYLTPPELEVVNALSQFPGSFPQEAASKAAAKAASRAASGAGVRGDAGAALLEALISMAVLQRADSGGGSGAVRLTMHLLYRELAPGLRDRSHTWLSSRIKWAACGGAVLIPAAALCAYVANVVMSVLNSYFWGMGNLVACSLLCLCLYVADRYLLDLLSPQVMVVMALISRRAAAVIGRLFPVVSQQSLDRVWMVWWVLLGPDGPGRKLASQGVDPQAGVGVSECREVVREDDANLRNATQQLEKMLEGARDFVRLSLWSWTFLHAALRRHIERVCRAAAAMVRAGCARRGGHLARVMVGVSSNALGGRHPTTLAAMDCRASAMHALGDWQQARELQEEVLALRQRVLGPEHPDTLATMCQLAMMLASLDEHAAAFALQVEVLVAMTAAPLERVNRLALETLSNLAGSMWCLELREAATLLAEGAVKNMQEVLGPRDPSTLAAVGNLAGYLCSRGEHARARELQEGVLEARARVLGRDHPSTLTAMHELAATLVALGSITAARERVEEALELGRGLLGPGPTHPTTLAAKACLGAVLRSEGALAEARQLQEEVLAAFRELLGPEHHLTVAASKALGDTRSQQERQLLGLSK